jgi:hypothetical protein
VDQVHRHRLAGLRTSLNTGRWLLDRRPRWILANRYLGLQSRPFITDPTVECNGSLEFEFSWATMVGFWWCLLLRDHNDEGNVFMLTIIGGERQRSPATVRRLSRCLSTVRAASSEAWAPRTCAQGFLKLPSSFLTDQLLQSVVENSNLVAT